MQKILIVDDDPTLIDFLKMLLETEGYEIREATDGAAALQLIPAFKPDAMLLDYLMPKGMNGLEVLRQVRDKHPEIAIIMLTGKGNEQIAVDCMKAGAADYVVKPFDNERLLSALRTVMTP